MNFLQTVIIPSSDYAGNDVLVQASLSNQVEYAPLQTPTPPRNCNPIWYSKCFDNTLSASEM